MQKAYLIFIIISTFGLRSVIAQNTYISDSSCFLPSVIMQSDFINTNPITFNDSTKQIKITSIDWKTYTVKINKPIWLPRFMGSSFDTTVSNWQIYRIGKSNDDPNFVLQLTEQINKTSFKFKIQPRQTIKTLSSDTYFGGILPQIAFRNYAINWEPLWKPGRKFSITNSTKTYSKGDIYKILKVKENSYIISTSSGLFKTTDFSNFSIIDSKVGLSKIVDIKIYNKNTLLIADSYGSFGGFYIATIDDSLNINKITKYNTSDFTSVNCILIDETNVYLGTTNGVYFSNTKCNTFKAIDSLSMPFQIYSINKDKDYLYAGVSSEDVGQKSTIYRIPLNFSKSWEDITSNISLNITHSIINDNNNIFIGGDSCVFQFLNNKWVQTGNNLLNINYLYKTRIGLFAGTDNGLYNLINNTWVKIAETNCKVSDLCINGDITFLGTKGADAIIISLNKFKYLTQDTIYVINKPTVLTVPYNDFIIGQCLGIIDSVNSNYFFGFIVSDVNNNYVKLKDDQNINVSNESNYIYPSTSFITTVPNIMTIDSSLSNLRSIDEDGTLKINWFNSTLFKSDNKYVALITLNNPNNSLGFAISTSTDFKNWTQISRINNYNNLALPVWTDSNINNIFPRNSNIEENGNYIIPYNAIKKGINISRTGIIKIKNFNDITTYFFSSAYFSPKDENGKIFQDDNTLNYGYSNFCKYNGLYFVALDIIKNGKRSIYIYTSNNLATVGSDLNGLNLEFIQKINNQSPKDFRMMGSWNSDLNGVPSMFTYRNNLFLMTQGTTKPESYIYGNKSNCNGLYIWNDKLKIFEEYFSNPLMINPNMSGWEVFGSSHLGIPTILNDEGNLKALFTIHRGTNTYRVLPIILNPASIEEMKEFKNKNNLK